jgi:hypothetical protein
MELEGSLLCSQQLVICLTPESDRVHILAFTSWSSRYLLLHVPHQNLVYIFRLPERTTCSSQSILLKCITQIFRTYWKLHFTILHLSVTVSRFLSSFQDFWKICFVHWLQPICSTCPDYLILLDFLKSLMYSEDKLWKSSSWNFVHRPITSLFWVVRFYGPYTPTRLGRE